MNIHRFFSLKIAVAYFILGFLWILFSDYILKLITNDVTLLTQLQNYKGWFYIAVTAGMLYWLIRGELAKKNKLLRELDEAKQKAEESDRLKTAFLSNMSHEIRTPLNGILGFSNLISEENLSTENRQLFLDQINMNGQLLLKIINDIIEISKIQENMLSIQPQQVDINQLLKNVVKAYALNGSPIARKGLELRVINEFSGKPVFVYSDPARILQVLVNLIDNAIKYTDRGSISLGCQKENNEVALFVEDTGPGIPEEHQSIIFERFKQTSTSKETGAGFGLGLSISKGIVEALHGHIELQSKPGEGSRFTVFLPVKWN